MSDMTVGVLVAFYLFLAVRWDLVRRPLPYLVGACAVGVVILSGLFGLGTGGRSVGAVFTVLGLLTAFGAGIATCCAAKLPIDTQSPPAPPADDPEIM
jgi:hypothetical protein